MKLFQFFITFLLATSSLLASGIDDSLSIDNNGFSVLAIEEREDGNPVMPILKNITFNGYARFFGYGRTLDEVYSNALNAQAPVTARIPRKVIGFSDGYQRSEPIVRLDMLAVPSPNVSFKTDVTFYTDWDGSLHTSDTLDSRYSLNLGISLQGNFKTKLGSFTVQAGGINWFRLSPLTMWDFEGYFRRSNFERFPWDPSEQGIDRAKNLFQTGGVNTDTRFGKRPFQGFSLEAKGLPKKLSLTALFGKTQIEGYDNFTSVFFKSVPNYVIAGKITKELKNGEVSFNTFNNFKYFSNYSTSPINNLPTIGIDPYSDTLIISNIATLGYKRSFGKIKFDAEFGVGRFLDVDRNKDFDWEKNILSEEFLTQNVGVDLKFYFPKEVTFLPISLELFSLGSGFLNPNAAFSSVGAGNVFNNSDRSEKDRLTPPGFFQPAFTPLREVGRLSNNSYGLDINSNFIIGKFKMNFGFQNSMQHDTLADFISYENRINGLTIGRLAPFSSFGANKRITSNFRSSYQNIEITQPVNNKLSTSIFQSHAMYGTKLFDRELFLFYILSLGSINDGFHLFPDINRSNYNRSTLLRYDAHEADIFYKVQGPVTLVFSGGFERSMGNYRTVRDVNSGLPTKQESYFVGLGGNIDLGPNVALYLRHRIFDHFDKNFDYDHLKGQETSAELKMFF